jgi:hypothetical protein
MRPRRTLLARRLFRPLSLALHRAHRAALRRPRLVLLLAALAFAAALAAASRGRMALSIRDTVDASARSARWMAEMEQEFGAGHSILLLFSRPPPGQGRLGREDLAAIHALVAREQERNPELAGATTPWDARRARREDGRLRLVPVLEGDDPAGLAALAASPLGGLLTDREGRDAAVELVFRDSVRPGFYGRFDPRPIGALLERARTELARACPGLEVRLSGTAAFEWHALVAQRSITVLNAVVLLVILLAFRLLLGTWRSGILMALVVGWAGALVYGGLALAGMPVDILSTGLFLMLAVAAIEDFVFIGWERLRHGTQWRRAFRVLLFPGALTSLTTVVGFASLCTSELASIRRFGTFGAFGAALEWVATFLFLPALLRVAPRLRAFVDPARSLAPARADRMAGPRLPPRLALAALLVLPVAAWAALHLDFHDSPSDFFPAGHPYREAMRSTAGSRGWVGMVHVVFPEDASPRQVAEEARRLADVPGVAQVLDPGTMLADWTSGDHLAIFELAGDLTPAATGGLVGRSGRMRAAVFLADADIGTALGLRDAVLRAFPGGDGFPAGDVIAYAEFGEVVPRALLRSLGTCLVLVGLLIFLVYRSAGLGSGLRAVLASLFGPSVALCAVWLSGLHVNFVTAVFASVLVGLTGDNAVQFAAAAHGGTLQGAIRRRGGAAAMVAAVMSACALTFLGSAFVPPRRLGLLLAFGLLAAFVGDVWILRGLVGERRGAPPSPVDDGA